MPAAATPSRTARFTPIEAEQRIEALDVVRGFALLGIFLMNIEWFNRPFAAFNEGMPRDLTGADWVASWFVAYFVQGKFWTIFSLLFGMGFAVMLMRAERAGRGGRAFLLTYLRRIVALAVFGAVHYLYLWHGDILFSYAVAAGALLIVLHGRFKWIVIAAVVLFGLSAIPGADLFAQLGGGVASYGLFALFLRGERRVVWRGRAIPLFSFLLLVAGCVVAIAAVVFWVLPEAPTEPRVPLTAMGPILLAFGWLSWRYREPAEKRGVRLAVALYVFASTTMIAMGLVHQFTPNPELEVTTSLTATSDPAKPVLVPTARATELKKKRAERLVEQATDKADELRVYTQGSYFETVGYRGREFLEKAAGDAGFAALLIGMFLLGMWFVRSGVMQEPARHLPFFRRLALWGLPIGIGLGLATEWIAMSHTPGDRYDGWTIARGLTMLGNLPACLGYVGLVVTMLYSRTALSRIRVLAPAGRMALTNYLTQSVVCMLWFDGFALGHWGIPRGQQVLFVAIVYSAQIVFSTWWLGRFRYGPVEWLWRGFTYRELPAMRRAPILDGVQMSS